MRFEVIIDIPSTPQSSPSLVQPEIPKRSFQIYKSNQVHPIHPILTNYTYNDSRRIIKGIPNWLVGLVIVAELAAICAVIAIYGGK